MCPDAGGRASGCTARRARIVRSRGAHQSEMPSTPHPSRNLPVPLELHARRASSSADGSDLAGWCSVPRARYELVDRTAEGRHHAWRGHGGAVAPVVRAPGGGVTSSAQPPRRVGPVSRRRRVPGVPGHHPPMQATHSTEGATTTCELDVEGCGDARRGSPSSFTP